MTTDVYIITVTGPGWLNANDRIHWTERRMLTEQWRTNAGWAAKAAKVPAIKGRASIVAVVIFPDRRRRDVANWYPTVKPCVDGLVDAGVLADDDDSHLDGPFMYSRVEPGTRRPTVELHITECGDEP